MKTHTDTHFMHEVARPAAARHGKHVRHTCGKARSAKGPRMPSTPRDGKQDDGLDAAKNDGKNETKDDSRDEAQTRSENGKPSG